MFVFFILKSQFLQIFSNSINSKIAMAFHLDFKCFVKRARVYASSISIYSFVWIHDLVFFWFISHNVNMALYASITMLVFVSLVCIRYIFSTSILRSRSSHKCILCYANNDGNFVYLAIYTYMNCICSIFSHYTKNITISCATLKCRILRSLRIFFSIRCLSFARSMAKKKYIGSSLKYLK